MAPSSETDRAFLPNGLFYWIFENNAYDIQNELKFKYPDLNLTAVIANIREEQRIDNIFRQYRPDVVFHAAAHKHVPLMEENL